jgi:hypothetical protein
MKNYDALGNFVIFKITDENNRSFLDMTTFHNQYNFKYNLKKYLSKCNEDRKCSFSPVLKYFQDSNSVDFQVLEKVKNAEYFEAVNKIIDYSKNLRLPSSKCVI